MTFISATIEVLDAASLQMPLWHGAHDSLVVTTEDTGEQELIDASNVILDLVKILKVDAHVHQTLGGE